MQVSSDASKKALIQSWLAKEAVPVDQAVFSSGGSENIFMKILKYFMKNPMYIFGMIYLIKQFLRYLEALGKDEGQKEL